MEKGIHPGLRISGGLEYGRGIYVTGLENKSPAERGGLKVGDQILAVNNHDFRNVLHDEAVDILKSSPRLNMKVRYIGNLPSSPASIAEEMNTSHSSCSHVTSEASSSSKSHHTDYSGNRILSPRCSIRHSSHHHRRASRSPCGSRMTPSEPSSSSNSSRAEQGNLVTPPLMVIESTDDLLEKKLNQLLPEKDQITFAYYRNEYETKGMTIDAFVALSLELLATSEKYSLVNHIRSIIREEDLDKFDELIYKREEQAMIKSKANIKDTGHFITSEDEESSECSISFGQDQAGSDYHSAEDGGLDNSQPISFPMERSISRNGSGSRLGVPEMSSLLPLPFSSKEVPRRHSSCTAEAQLMSAASNDFLGVPNRDERRWSSPRITSDARDISTNYVASNYGFRDPLERRRFSGSEMKGVTMNGRSFRSPSYNHLLSHMNHSSVSNGIGRIASGGDLNYSERDGINRYSPIPQSRVRRHSSLPGPASKNPFKTVSPLHPHRTSPFQMPSYRAIQEPDGKLRMTVKKSKPILGIAIEGGSDVVSQPQPRIISIHNTGAAFDTGDLHVGHIILEVDRKSTANLKHEEVAQLIADAYYHTPNKDHIEFLVREKSKHEFDLRRSSFMLLNNSFE
ncbi:whirlin-like [Brevipalpus obovatus]|uniref:whirlin-like n=1 Tax=Brevipalpus obovatus TaxID=246614 RepID=UPI003D9DDDDC